MKSDLVIKTVTQIVVYTENLHVNRCSFGTVLIAVFASFALQSSAADTQPLPPEHMNSS